MSDFIDAMPKAELHVHLEGTLEADLSFELAKKNGVALPYDSPEALLAAYDFHDLPSFLAIYYKGMEVLRDEADFFELTWRKTWCMPRCSSTPRPTPRAASPSAR
jgi:adenosine deaminase